MIRLCLPIAALAAAACQPVPAAEHPAPPQGPATACGSHKIADMVGKQHSPALEAIVRERSGARAIRWIAPGTWRDDFPRWSPDGKLAWIRRSGQTFNQGAPRLAPTQHASVPAQPSLFWLVPDQASRAAASGDTPAGRFARGIGGRRDGRIGRRSARGVGR